MAIEKITVPDFGDVQEITVVEVYISKGDQIETEDPLVALESEKAVMDIPSPFSGVITEVKLKEGDTVSSDDLIALLEVDAAGEQPSPPADSPKPQAAQEPPAAEPPDEAAVNVPDEPQETAVSEEPETQTEGKFHATPSVRAYARELGVELAAVTASGPKGRILKEDVQLLVKQALKGGGGAPKTAALPFTEAPLEDFSKYGEIEEVALGRIQKISGPHLHRSWVSIPHVTHFDEADITELEKFRKEMNNEPGPDSVKFSPLIFVIKTLVATLKAYPLFNSSLVPGGEKLILKKYYHVGIAVDTPNGLVVPVVKNVDRKGIRDIALELNKLSANARDGKLAIQDMQGATFTISSLGGIGGTGFTPIVNGPQVAILGLSKSYQ